jgi:hypothetical protein
MNKKKEYKKNEILNRLKWFHGEEFNKYPLDDESFKSPYIKK